MLIGTVVLLLVGVGLYFLWPPLALLVVPVLIWLFAFFRDPERPLPDDRQVYVSPADGTVSDILELPNFELIGEPCVRVGIFLSVFNVHVNRAPCDGRVVKLVYKEGKFLNALKHEACSAQNESNTIVLAEPNGERPVAVVKQIVGAIARRIVCTPHVGDVLARGQRFGMIKFGSRTELYIPKRLDPQVLVQVGQKVRGAADVIARIGVKAAPDEMASAAAAQRLP